MSKVQRMWFLQIKWREQMKYITNNRKINLKQLQTMRKLVFITAALCVGFFSLNAQNRTPKVGVFAAYGTEIEAIGAGVNAEISIVEKISVVPSVSYFFTKGNTYVKTSFMEFNADGHYTFLESKVDVYALAGLNYAHTRVKVGSNSASNGEIGFNLGAGANFNLNLKIIPFAEVKYTLGSTDQVVVSGGIRYQL